MTLIRTTASLTRHDSLALKVLPTLLLGCFVAQPLFAQTSAPANPSVQPPAKTTPAANATNAPTTPAATAGKTTTTGAATQQSGGVEDDMSTVEVVATRPVNKVDRDVYELKNDISISNASAADILNNVPSVTVDQDGTVQLRGNSNVQIMVNGKRDAQFQGANRGDALNSFPAEAIESVEVINVPGAEFGNEGGSGPIINLVLKRNRKPGSRANLSFNKGTEDRYNAFVNGEYAAGPYSISGNLGVRKNERNNYRLTEREDLDPATGNVIGGLNSSNNTKTDQQGVTMASTFTYNVGERDQAGASLSYSKNKTETDSFGSSQRFGASMIPVSDYDTRTATHSPAETFGFGASYDHRSGLPGEALKFDLRYTGQNNNRNTSRDYDYRLQPAIYTTNNISATDSRNRILDISVDYERIVWEDWKLQAGAKFADSKNQNPTDYVAIDPVTGLYVPVPARISNFDSDDKNTAIYGTLSTKLSDTIQVKMGLRGEHTVMDVRQPLLSQENKYYYMNWLPSFYVSKDVSDTGNLNLRMSRRVARPNERDLNPNLVYLNDFNARQGNPHLQPVNNDNFELAYRDQFFGINSAITLFKRRESPVVSNRSYLLPTDPNVVVTSPINFGVNDQTGVELNFNIRQLFIPGLSANLGETYSHVTRTRVSNFTTTSNDTVEQHGHQQISKLRLAYGYNVDSFQLSINHSGKQLTGQGTNGPTTITNFSWQHKITPRFSLNLNVNNVFRSGNSESFTDNEVLRLHNLSTPQTRVFLLGLRYQFGGVTGDDRIRNGNRGMFRGQGGPGGNRGGDGGGFGGGGFGGGGGGGGGRF